MASAMHSLSAGYGSGSRSQVHDPVAPCGGISMRTLRFAVAGLLVLFCAALILERTAAVAGDKDKDKDKESKKTVRMFLVSVKVSETNKDGKSWDPNDGKPDLYVVVKNLSDP